MKLLTLFIVPVLLIGCPGPVVPVPAPIPQDTSWCLKAEQNLENLRCKDREGDPMWVNKLGERFQKTCEVAQIDGRIFLNPKCVATAATCNTALKCPIIE